MDSGALAVSSKSSRFPVTTTVRGQGRQGEGRLLSSAQPLGPILVSPGLGWAGPDSLLGHNLSRPTTQTTETRPGTSRGSGTQPTGWKLCPTRDSGWNPYSQQALRFCKVWRERRIPRFLYLYRTYLDVFGHTPKQVIFPPAQDSRLFDEGALSWRPPPRTSAPSWLAFSLFSFSVGPSRAC